MVSQKEARARLKINALLEASGWQLLDTEKGRANVDVETKTDLGDDFEHTKTGFIDYLLLDDNQKPIAVLEAKRESIAPLSAKEQARKYANSKHIRFVILSNGNTHYFWDIETGNPEPIMSFPMPKSLTEYSEYKPDNMPFYQKFFSRFHIPYSVICDTDHKENCQENRNGWNGNCENPSFTSGIQKSIYDQFVLDKSANIAQYFFVFADTFEPYHELLDEPFRFDDSGADGKPFKANRYWLKLVQNKTNQGFNGVPIIRYLSKILIKEE